MRVDSKVTLAVASIVAAGFMLTGCMQSEASSSAQAPKVKPSIAEEQLGLRDIDLLDENTVLPDETKYSQSYAGSGKMYDRAFQDAPPMIPHSVEGLIPVTRDNNSCIGCHAPEVAPSMNATALPESHFLNMRPKHTMGMAGFSKAIDNLKNEVSIQKIDKLSGSRYNCTQCHAPQSEGDLVVDNLFQPEFTDEEGKRKSSWSGSNLNEGLDTIIE